MITRLFCDAGLAADRLVTLPEAQAHHARRVLRLRTGDALVLFDGRGGEYFGRIATLDPAVRVAVERHVAAERESPLPITLAQVIPAGDRMDWVVQKAVELGASAIVPLLSHRSVVRLSGERAERRRTHWQQIAIGACEQCGRNRIPEVRRITELTVFLAESSREGGFRLVLSPDAEHALGAMGRPEGPVTVLIGPEGGFDEGEHEAARLAGFALARLGPRILRSDTAGAATIVALLSRWGDL